MAEWKSLNLALGHQKVTSVLAQAQLLQGITTTVRDSLPEDLAPHCQVESYDHDQLVIAVNGCGYATLIYFHQHDILKQANQKFAQRLGYRFKKLRVLVRYAG